MPKKTMSYPGHEKRKTTPIHDEIQIALATANETMLKDLITQCSPPVYVSKNPKYSEYLKEKDANNLFSKISKISSEVEVSINGTRNSADGIITYEEDIHYEGEFSADDERRIQLVMARKFRVLIEIKTEIQSFGETLRQIKKYRDTIKGITAVILVCDTVSELEAEGFISQGISIYSATRLVLPLQANCAICVTECPLRGEKNSPVMRCSSFDTEVN